MKVGIDFGTSTSEIAFVDKNGLTTVVPNSLGETVTPSVVYYSSDGHVVVGREAKEMALLDPDNAFLEVKRLFGQDRVLNARGKDVAPPDVASEIIKYLINCAQAHTGETVDSAVITVPAYFTDAQRKDVVAAGIAAGIEVSRIINEPTAASLDYGIDHMSECQYILVYDLGGGTLDVTVLELFEGVVDVKASCGNNALGGKDFDQALIDHITAAIKKKDKVDVTNDLRVQIHIKAAAEACKIALSENESYDIGLPFLYQDKHGNAAGYAENITRTSFECMIKDKIVSTKKQIDQALFDAGLKAADIDIALLVGGSTRIPFVSAWLEDAYGFLPESAVDPDLAVVKGAAIQAGVLSGVLSENAIVLTDVCPYSLSTKTLTHIGFNLKTHICDVIIPRNTTLPAAASKIYQTAADDQTCVHVTAYQGESDDPDENELLNTFVLDGIPKGKAGRQKINISLAYDLNGILAVSGQIVSTGKSVRVEVDTGRLGKNLDLNTWKDVPASNVYRKIINRADRLSKVHGDDAANVVAAAIQLKKALILGWESAIIADYENDLHQAIKELDR